MNKNVFMILLLCCAVQLTTGYCYAGYDDPKGGSTATGAGTDW